MKSSKIFAIVLLVIVASLVGIASADFLKMRTEDTIRPSTSSCVKVGRLSDYLPSIKGTSGDTRIFFMDSKKPGATVLVLGGTHPNEAAGFMAALILVENLEIQAGRFIVIPQACQSGFTCTDPLEGCPEFYTIKTKTGERTFRAGSRVSNPLDQWPDPLVYRHFPSGQSLSGFETRNLNRSYPGRVDGCYTEKIGYAIMQLLKKENVDVAFDLHEAAPEIPIINAIVTHDKNREIGAAAIFNLEMESLTYALELSPKNFHGLSHREWGDSTSVLPFLMETCNPIQGRLRGRTDTNLLIEGNDKFYATAQKAARFRITYDAENGSPLKTRVARHIQGIKAILDGYNEAHPEKPIMYSHIPTYSELNASGIGNFLK
ncbi:MAG: succinylglutamate desuccinylase [Ignavibacteria bacterium]|nr:succinylglutamate desuccinylase [Ignavibacteria bacterium]